MKEIFERVSIRKYTDQPVENEKILAILRAAMAAPSAGNQQPWEFYVVRDRSKLEALSQVSPLWAPAYAQIDMSIAMENLWLACGEQGLGGVWLGIAPIEERMKAVEEILAIPEGFRAFAIFPLGYPAESRKQQDRFDESRIHFV